MPVHLQYHQRSGIGHPRESGKLAHHALLGDDPFKDILIGQHGHDVSMHLPAALDSRQENIMGLNGDLSQAIRKGRQFRILRQVQQIILCQHAEIMGPLRHGQMPQLPLLHLVECVSDRILRTKHGNFT